MEPTTIANTARGVVGSPPKWLITDACGFILFGGISSVTLKIPDEKKPGQNCFPHNAPHVHTHTHARRGAGAQAQGADAPRHRHTGFSSNFVNGRTKEKGNSPR